MGKRGKKKSKKGRPGGGGGAERGTCAGDTKEALENAFFWKERKKVRPLPSPALARRPPIPASHPSP